MIVVHHLNNSRSQRILWLLEELGECCSRMPI
jgi:glutathione S-transferase